MRISNKARSMKTACRSVTWLGLLLALGCEPAARHTAVVPPTPVIAPVEPSTPVVDVAKDAGGFTITEQIPLTDQVRADYDEGRRSLEEGKYEPGIASMLKVTEQAPSLTAAHIDLGIAYARAGDLDRA